VYPLLTHDAPAIENDGLARDERCLSRGEKHDKIRNLSKLGHTPEWGFLACIT
jgi:hypothetical protein